MKPLDAMGPGSVIDDVRKMSMESEREKARGLGRDSGGLRHAQGRYPFRLTTIEGWFRASAGETDRKLLQSITAISTWNS